MHKDTIKLFQIYLRDKEVEKIAYHGEIFRAKTTKTFPSLDLALGLVLATNGPRFHASPTWFQSTSSHENRAPVQNRHFVVQSERDPQLRSISVCNGS